MTPRPPHVAEALLRAVHRPGHARDGLLGDLHESFLLVAQDAGPPAARRWYWRQAARLAGRHLFERAVGRRVWDRRWRTLSPALPADAGPDGGRRKRSEPVRNFINDLRFSLRIWRTNPGFSAVVVAMLAVGIGVNAAVFSIVDEVLLRPLPYERPDRIVQVWGTNETRGSVRWGASLHDYEDWRRQSETLAEIGVYVGGSANLNFGDTPERVRFAQVSPSVFTVLGVSPAMGRVFREEENLPGNDAVVVVSHGFWNDALGADPEAVGGTVTLDGTPMTIVGVMPEGFYFPGTTTQLWKPIGMRPGDAGDRGGRWVSSIGRLADGRTLEEAQREMSAVAAALEEAYPETNTGVSVFLEPRHAFTVVGSAPMVTVTWAIVGLILLIACANVANLVLIRSTARGREMAIRASLGAGRARLIGQLLAENLILGLTGGAAGVLIAFWITSFLSGLSATGIPRISRISVDATVVAYAIGLALLTTLLFGLAPALSASRLDLSSGLKEGGTRAAGGGLRRTRELLVAAEIALSVVVLIGAALLLRTFWSLQQVDLGFEIDNRIEARLSPSWREIPEREQARVLYRRIVEGVAALPGVESVGGINTLPLAGANRWGTRLDGDGIQADSPSQLPPALYRAVAGDYFETMGIELIAGRPVGASDDAGAPRVIVLSRRAAESAWPGEDPLGKQVWFVPPDHPAHVRYTVVGVAADVADNSLSREPSPLIYINLDQAEWGHFQDWGMSVVAHTAADPATLIEPMRQVIRVAAPSLPLFQVQPIAERLDGALAPSRFNLTMIGAFGALGLALAALGVYGAMAFMVSQRTHEIGMRLALGAGRGQVTRLVVGRGMLLALSGVALGVLVALAASRTIESLLFGVTGNDPIAYAGIALLLLAVTVLASFLPARRAAAIDALTCLRRGE